MAWQAQSEDHLEGHPDAHDPGAEDEEGPERRLRPGRAAPQRANGRRYEAEGDQQQWVRGHQGHRAEGQRPSPPCRGVHWYPPHRVPRRYRHKAVAPTTSASAATTLPHGHWALPRCSWTGALLLAGTVAAEPWLGSAVAREVVVVTRGCCGEEVVVATATPGMVTGIGVVVVAEAWCSFAHALRSLAESRGAGSPGLPVPASWKRQPSAEASLARFAAGPLLA